MIADKDPFFFILLIVVFSIYSTVNLTLLFAIYNSIAKYIKLLNK